MESMEFNLQLQEVPVVINGEHYVLTELDGSQRDRYLSQLGKRVMHGKDGQAATLKNFDGLQASLIAVALYRIEHGNREPVSVDTIQQWPAHVIDKLFKRAQKLSALDDKEGEGNV